MEMPGESVRLVIGLQHLEVLVGNTEPKALYSVEERMRTRHIRCCLFLRGMKERRLRSIWERGLKEKRTDIDNNPQAALLGSVWGLSECVWVCIQKGLTLNLFGYQYSFLSVSHFRRHLSLSESLLCLLFLFIPPSIQTRESRLYNGVTAVLCALMSQLVCRRRDGGEQGNVKNMKATNSDPWRRSHILTCIC